MNKSTDNRVQLKTVKRGDYVRLSENGAVYVRGEYCRIQKKYSLYKFEDVNHEIFKRGTFPVLVGFDF